MSQRADKFLNIFSSVEKFLKSKYNGGDYAPFRDLVRRAMHQNAVIKRYRDDLYSYADLRNVMVHNSRRNGRVIAEPLPEIVEHFEMIWNDIQHPEKVSMFKKKVHYCFSDDTLDKALRMIHNHKISQIPILQSGKIYDVLNGNHIANWLAAKEIVSPQETKISEVLEHADRSNNYEVISGDTSVFEAAEIYKSSFKKQPVNWYYDALLITPTGKKDEHMIGIIVLKDIAKYMNE